MTPISSGVARATFTQSLGGPTSFVFQAHYEGDATFESKTSTTVNHTVTSAPPANQPPVFTKGPNQTVNEDAGAQSVSNWATGISPIESGQTVDFIVSNDNTALFSAQPAISANGTLTYTPAANAHGSATVTVQAHDDGGTANNGDDTSDEETFTITVNSVNDAPSFIASNPPPVVVNAGAQSLANWATFSPGPANESAQTATYTVSDISNASLFSSAPSVAANGTLSYTPAGITGSSTFKVRVQDNGGTANSGVDTSAQQTFTITVHAVNSRPTFTPGGGPTVLEDAAAQTVPNWATNISPGPAADSWQTVSFEVTGNTNAALFSAGPAVSSSGTLTFTPAANKNGSATITLVARDNGGTAGGGQDTSDPPATFTITVTPVNDAPTVTANNPPAVNEDATGQIVPNWASMNPGPPDEAGQTALAYTVQDVSDPAKFSAGPAVAADGTLTYTPAPNAYGTVTFKVKVRDSGGTNNGGVDTSALQTYTITINGVNDAPSFTASNPPELYAIASPQTIPNWATFNPGSNESDQTATYVIQNVSNPDLFASPPAVSPSGTLTYTPRTTAPGTSTFTLYVRDSGGTDNGGVDMSPPQTFTITVHRSNSATTAAGPAAPSVSGQQVTFTATVSAVAPGAGTPTGTVLFKKGGTTLGSGLVNGAGLAAATFPLPVGTHTITAEYQGDANFFTSSGTAPAHTVTKASSSVTLSAAPNPSVYSQLLTLTATVVGVSPGGGTPTGTVVFKKGGTTLGSVALNGGVATLEVDDLDAGSYTLTAEYQGDSEFFGSTSNSVSQTVNKAQTDTLLHFSPENGVLAGQQVVLTATVYSLSPATAPPTGTVNFTNDGAPLATVTLTPSPDGLFATASTFFTVSGPTSYVLAANYTQNE